MFGLLRYILALMVFQTHIWRITPWTGNYAVFTFFVLSGYLMTLVLNEQYASGRDGLSRFFVNRGLRIYPLYWIVIVMSVLICYYAPSVARQVHPEFSLPGNGSQWIMNIVIFGANHPVVSTLIIPAWSLHIELVFYGLMGVLLSRSPWIALIWLVLSAGYAADSVMRFPSENQFWYYRYFPVAAGSLGFSLGACAYFVARRFKSLVGGKNQTAVIVLTVFVLNVLASGAVWKYNRAIYTQGFYISLALSFFLVIMLGAVDTDRVPSWMRKADGFLGDLSYPLFLVHIPVAALVVIIGFHSVRPTNQRLFLWSLPFAHLAAGILALAVGKRIESIRNMIKTDRS